MLHSEDHMYVKCIYKALHHLMYCVLNPIQNNLSCDDSEGGFKASLFAHARVTSLKRGLTIDWLSWEKFLPLVSVLQSSPPQGKQFIRLRNVDDEGLTVGGRLSLWWEERREQRPDCQVQFSELVHILFSPFPFRDSVPVSTASPFIPLPLFSAFIDVELS